MRKLWAAMAVVAMLAVAAIVLAGWDITRDRRAPTSVPLPSPTAVPPTAITLTPTPLATPAIVATSSPVRIMSPTPLATPASPNPGSATLASGADVQNGRLGYTYWCAHDAVGTCVMSERYGGPVPLESLHVSPGAMLTYTYRGSEPLMAISSKVFSLAGAGGGDYPLLRGGTPLPTTQTDHQAAITAPAVPGEYVIIVHITGDKNTTADFQFRILVS